MPPIDSGAMNRSGSGPTTHHAVSRATTETPRVAPIRREGGCN